MLRSICLPTKRNFLKSRKSVDSALMYLKNSTNTELLIADNSSDKEKSDYLKNNDVKNLKYFNTDGFSQVQNSFICYENASGRFISSMGDDDFIFSNGIFDERNISQDIVGIRPSFAVWDKTIGIHGFSNFTIMSDDPIIRIKEYFVKAKGNNNTLYSFFDKKLYEVNLNNQVTEHLNSIVAKNCSKDFLKIFFERSDGNKKILNELKKIRDNYLVKGYGFLVIKS